MSETKVKTASVKVMQSYNYCHFEASMTIENEDGLELLDIDGARKNCQRLTDKAVKQYQKAKEMAAKGSDGQFFNWFTLILTDIELWLFVGYVFYERITSRATGSVLT